MIEEGRYSEALTALRHAASLGLDDARLHRDFGTALALCQRFEDALRELDLALKKDKNVVGGNRGRAMVLLRLGRLTLAQAAVKNAIKQVPEDAHAHVIFAMALRGLGQPSQARMEVELARTLDYDRPLRLDYLEALILGDLGQAQAAIDKLDNVAKTATDDVEIQGRSYAAMGRYLGQLDQLVDARHACDQAIALGEASPYTFATRAWVLHRLSEIDEADSSIRRAVDAISDSTAPAGRRWSIYLNHAAICNSLAEVYDDDEMARDAIAYTGQAQQDLARAERERSEPQISAELAERVAHIFFERARGHLYLAEAQPAAAALRQCQVHAPRFSRPWIAASHALRSESKALRPLPNWLIVGTALSIWTLSIVLFIFFKFSSVALATLLIAAPALALAGYSLPVLTRLKVSGVEIQKSLTAASARSLRSIPPPPPLPETALNPRAIPGRR